MVTILTEPTIFHINTFARPVGSTRSRHWSRRHNQGIRERCCQLLARAKGSTFLSSRPLSQDNFSSWKRDLSSLKPISTWESRELKMVPCLLSFPHLFTLFFQGVLAEVLWYKNNKKKHGYCKITTGRFPLHDYVYRWRIRDENNYLIQHVACCKVIRKSVARVL